MKAVRTLVTGATGYIGSRLVTALLSDGHDVVAASRHPDRLADFGWSDRVSTVALDAHDEDSARLLESYLDRRFGDSWRADDEASAGGEESEEQANAGGPLTESEALDILGLKPGATQDEIIQAHRRMMQKVHPDRGGSNYLAARINEAKACLLG